MREHISASSRRALLTRATAMAAGAVGLGLGLGRASPTSTSPGRAVGREASGAAAASILTLHGQGWFLSGSGRRPGEIPAHGQRGTVTGDLLDAPDGRAVGTFHAACFHGGGAAADLELHTFSLAEGMLVGMGATSVGEGSFAIVGGTGRYAGARGVYTARQGVREVGGDGTAEFAFTFIS